MKSGYVIEILILIFFCIVSRQQIAGLNLGSAFITATYYDKQNSFLVLKNKDSFSEEKIYTSFSLNSPREFGKDIFRNSTSPLKYKINYFIPLVGLNYTEALKYKEFYSLFYDMTQKDSERVSISLLDKNKNISYPLEEILAMILRYAKVNIDNFARFYIYNFSLSIPYKLQLNQRLAIEDAFKITRMNLQAIVPENLAVSIFVHNEKLEVFSNINILYINIGDECLKISHITHISNKGNSIISITNISNTINITDDQIIQNFEINDHTISNRQIDIKLAYFIFEKANINNLIKENENRDEIFSNLLIIAENAKEKLFNNETQIINLNILSLPIKEEIKITPSDFKNILKDMILKFEDTISTFFKKFSNIDKVALIGETGKMSIFIDRIQKIIGKDLPLLSFNNYSYASYGAAYISANFSNQLLKKPIKISFQHEEITIQAKPLHCNQNIPIISEYCRKNTLKAVLFDSFTPFNSNKTAKIPVLSDVEVIVNFDNIPFYKYVFTDISAFLLDKERDDSVPFILNLHFGYTGLGLPELNEFSLSIGILNNIEEATNSNISGEAEKAKHKIKYVKKEIKGTTNIITDYKNLTGNDIYNIQREIQIMEKEEDENSRLENAKYFIQDYISSVNDWMKEKANLEFLKDNEQKTIKSDLSEVEKYMNQNLSYKNMTEIKKKYDLLNKSYSIGYNRKIEYEKFDNHIQNANQLINSTLNELLILKIKYANITDQLLEPFYSEIENFRRSVLQIKNYRFRLPKYSDPLITNTKINDKTNEYNSLLKGLQKNYSLPINYGKSNCSKKVENNKNILSDILSDKNNQSQSVPQTLDRTNQSKSDFISNKVDKTNDQNEIEVEEEEEEKAKNTARPKKNLNSEL